MTATRNACVPGDNTADGPTSGLGSIALVANSGSRTGADIYQTARDYLEQRFGDIRAYRAAPGELGKVLDEAMATEPDLLIVAGGDGSVGAAAERVSGTATTLAVLPVGTANDFARTLSIPTDLVEALTLLQSGKIVDVDLGRVAGKPFLNVAAVGLATRVTERLTPTLKRRMGALAYPVAALGAYLTHEPFGATLTFPDGDHEPLHLDDLLQVAVGNGRHYGGGYSVSPSASIDDHLLDVYAIERGRLRDHVSIARLFRNGHFVEHERVHHFTTRRVRLECDRELAINLDGELAATTPATFEVERNAVHVLVPENSTAARWDG